MIENHELPALADPVPVLMACHRRVEEYLDRLTRIGRLLSASAPFAADTPTARQVERKKIHRIDSPRRRANDAMLGRTRSFCPAEIEQGLAFFGEALPLHVADEEQSLLPRLRARLKDPEGHFAWLLQHLEKDHRELDDMHRAFEDCARPLIDALHTNAAARLKDSVPPYRGALAALREVYRSHILVEDRDIFPAVEAALTPAERDDIGREMAARRGVALHERPPELFLSVARGMTIRTGSL